MKIQRHRRYVMLQTRATGEHRLINALFRRATTLLRLFIRPTHSTGRRRGSSFLGSIGSTGTGFDNNHTLVGNGDMRNVYPVKYYSREGFVEHKIEIDDEDIEEIVREYLERHADFDFDEVEVVNNRPVNIWLYAKCRKYLDPDASADEQETEAGALGAEVTITGDYDDNPTSK